MNTDKNFRSENRFIGGPCSSDVPSISEFVEVSRPPESETPK
jgi:hypothetical protein